MSSEGESKRLKLTREDEDIVEGVEDSVNLLDEVNYAKVFLQSYGFEDVPTEVVDTLSAILGDWINTVSKTFTFKKKTYHYFQVQLLYVY